MSAILCGSIVDMLAFFYIGFAILAVLSIGVSLVLTSHAWEHLRYARGSFRVDRTPCFLGRIGLIVPCKGADFALKENISCLFNQEHEDYEIYFVVESADDPACRIIRKILSTQSHINAYLIVAGETTHGGQKIHNLLCGYRALTPEVETIVFADSDVAPKRDWLTQLTIPLRLVNVHAVTSYRWFLPQRSGFANFLLFSINSAVMGLVCSRRQSVIWGGSWAILRETFRRSEIPDRWNACLSDDLFATARLNQLRLNIYFEPRCVVPSSLDFRVSTMWEFLCRQCFMGRWYLNKSWLLGVAHTSLSMLVFWGGLLCGGGLLLSGQPMLGSIGFAMAGLLWAQAAIRSKWRQAAGCFYVRSQKTPLQRARWFDFYCYPLTLTVLWTALCSVAAQRFVRWKGIGYRVGKAGDVQIIDREPSANTISGPLVIASSMAVAQPKHGSTEQRPTLSLYTEEKEITKRSMNRRIA